MAMPAASGRVCGDFSWERTTAALIRKATHAVRPHYPLADVQHTLQLTAIDFHPLDSEVKLVIEQR